MAEDLRSTLEAAVATEEAKVVETTAPPASAPAPESKIPVAPPEPKKFLEETKPLEAKSPLASPASEETLPQKHAEDTQKNEESPHTEVEKAPQSWKPSAKAKWDKVDPEIRTEVRRREREVEKVLSDNANVRKFSQGFQEAVKPFAPRYQSMNVSPIQAVRSLMQVDHTLALGTAAQKAQMMAKLVMDYGVDIGDLDRALAGEEIQENSPDTKLQRMLDERLAPLQSFIATTQAQREAAVQRDFEQQVRTVEAMETDPKFPHFDLVREDMADLLEISSKRKVSLSLEDAYNRAVAMNPEASRLQQETTQRTKAQEAHTHAQRALGASLSVGGAPASVKVPGDATDLRGTLEAAVAAHSGR